MYWTRFGSEDKEPKTIKVVDNGAFQVLQLGVSGMMPLKDFVRSKNSDVLQFYGPMRIPKTPVPRREFVYESPDLIVERFEKQTDPSVVLAMVNEFLRQMPEETRRKIPRTLRLPVTISGAEDLQAVFERFDEAALVWGMENDVDNPALDEVAHFLRAAWFQFEQLILDAMPFEDPGP